MDCAAVSDKELFDKNDYWQPPEDFEKLKKGDCEDFAFWTWRQFMDLGFDARVVFGRHGRIGHAWVQFFQDGRCFLVEPQWRRLGLTLPRLNTLGYQPKFSVAWNGEKLSYYQHRERTAGPPVAELVTPLPEYFLIWGRFWLGAPLRIPRLIFFSMKRFFKGFRWIGKTRRF
jgi:hypothetical protein